MILNLTSEAVKNEIIRHLGGGNQADINER